MARHERERKARPVKSAAPSLRSLRQAQGKQGEPFISFRASPSRTLRTSKSGCAIPRMRDQQKALAVKERALDVFEGGFVEAEEMAELVEESEADFFANDFIEAGAGGVVRGTVGGVGFDIFPVEDDASRLRRHIPEGVLGARDADEFAHEQIVFVLVACARQGSRGGASRQKLRDAQIAKARPYRTRYRTCAIERSLRGREIFDEDGDVGEQRTIFRGKRGESVSDELVELFASHKNRDQGTV